MVGAILDARENRCRASDKATERGLRAERVKNCLSEKTSSESRRFWLRPPADEAFWLVDLLLIVVSLESRREEADQRNETISEKHVSER